MPIWVIVLLLLVVGFAAMQIVIGNKTKKESDYMKQNFYKKSYKFLAKNFITQKSVRAIYAKLASLSVYKKEELYPLTTQYFLMSWGASSALVFFGFVLFNDFISVLICIAFAVLLNRSLVEKQLDKQYFKVLQATSNALGAVRQEYLITNSVVEAVNDSDIEDILKKPFDELYTILTSTDSELRLQEFYAATPFRTLQTLFGICFNINNQGDTQDINGESNFVQALTVLSGDINAEIRKIVTQKQKFGILEYLPFAPIFAIAAIEGYFSSIMPGTSLIYGGPIGYISRTLIIISSIISYSIISGINRNIPIKENDKSEWALAMLAKPKWSEFIYNLRPKNKKSIFISRRLKFALSRQTIDELYTQKVVIGIGVFLASFLIMFSVITLGGEYVESSTQQLSLVATNEMDKFSKESILELDRKYFEQRKALKPDKTLQEEINATVIKVQELTGLIPKSETEKFPKLEEESVKGLVRSYMPGLTDLQVLDQIKRLDDKFITYNNTTFHWWFIWIAFLLAFLGWKVPDMQIKLRRILVKTESEDDFLQLQTLIGILMTTDMDTLDTLGELAQHSRIHKEMLTYCYHGYPSNPELELTRLQAKTPLNEFKRFIGKLKLTINDLSLSEAFSDLMIERDQIMRLREVSIDATINRKRALCSPISLIPLGLLVLGELLIPLGYLGFREFMNAITMM